MWKICDFFPPNSLKCNKLLFPLFQLRMNNFNIHAIFYMTTCKSFFIIKMPLDKTLIITIILRRFHQLFKYVPFLFSR